MDKEAMARRLPEHPPEGLVEWVVKNHGHEELGGEYCIFTSERVRTPDGRSIWAADCTCTACQEDFWTRKEPGIQGFCMVVGEDGQYYTVEPWEEVNPYMGIELNQPGDEMECPFCGSRVKVVHRSEIGRDGKTKRIMVQSVQNVDGYTAIIYWMVWRKLWQSGISTYGAEPEDAYVLTERGGLQRFTHVERYGSFYSCSRRQLLRWKPMSGSKDISGSVYPDWGSISGRKCGTYVWPVYPDLEGTTGEKTALVEFLQADGYPPVAYLKLWKKYKSIENLCRQGMAVIVQQIIREGQIYCCSPDVSMTKYLDLAKSKPHEMLGISRAEFRWLRESKTELSLHDLDLWREYRKIGGTMGLQKFLEIEKQTGYINMMDAFEIVHMDGVTLEKLKRYLEKSGSGLKDAGVLKDTRKALRELYGRQELTNEELWPKHLHEAHDRAHRMLLQRKQEKEAQKLREGFQKVLDRYSGLQWTDGELCVVLPKDNDELVREGDVLRHCVGGYGDRHIDGSSVIFFVRHYRRPERPYYTLAIDMKGRPSERQLHGYGNERHGPNKEHSHSIPKKVRAFCDRWEDEVLLPWYQKQKKEKSA